MLGIKTTTYARTEREGKISCEIAIKLAEIFKIDIKELLYENPTEDNLRVVENYKIDFNFDDIFSSKIPILTMDGYETQLLTMFKSCNPQKQKTIMECAYSIYKSGI